MLKYIIYVVVLVPLLQ